MDLRIAIVENEKPYIKQLNECLLKWQKENERNVKLVIDIFIRGEDILSSNYEYEVIFLDIELGGDLNGVEVGKQLRENGFCKEIIFLTAYNEYVFQGYDVRAMSFILKPITEQRLAQCMRIILRNVNSGYYVFKDSRDGKIKRVKYLDILYFLSSRHSIEIITEKETYKQIKKLSSLSEDLPSYFYQCHRTIIVNVVHIQQIIKKNEIVMADNSILPVSGPYRHKIQFAFTLEFKER